jgi:hypothetical protein
LRPGISISLAFGRDYHERNERWNFVRDRDITRPDISRHYVNRTNNVTIINNSTVIVNTRKDNNRNVTYIAGPDRDDVQRVTRTPVKSVAIRERNQPGHQLNNGELQIYRPQVQKRIGNGQNPAPSKVTRLNDVKPASERNAGNRQQQPPTVNPPDKGQPTQPRVAKPADSKAKEKQPRTVTPPNKGQPAQPRDVRAADSKGQEKQPQKVTPPNKNRKEQPSRTKTNQDVKGKKQREL